MGDGQVVSTASTPTRMQPRRPKSVRYGLIGGLLAGIGSSAQVVACAIILAQREAVVTATTPPGQFVDGNAVEGNIAAIFNQTFLLVVLFALVVYFVIGYLAARHTHSLKMGIGATLMTAVIGWLYYLISSSVVATMGLHPWTPFVTDATGFIMTSIALLLVPTLLAALVVGTLGSLLGKRVVRRKDADISTRSA